MGASYTPASSDTDTISRRAFRRRAFARESALEIPTSAEATKNAQLRMRYESETGIANEFNAPKVNRATGGIRVRKGRL